MGPTRLAASTGPRKTSIGVGATRRDVVEGLSGDVRADAGLSVVRDAVGLGCAVGESNKMMVAGGYEPEKEDMGLQKEVDDLSAEMDKEK